MTQKRNECPYIKQAHYLRLATQGYSMREIEFMSGIAKTRLMRLITGETPMYLWECEGISRVTKNTIMMTNPTIIKEMFEEAMDIKFPRRHVDNVLHKPFDPTLAERHVFPDRFPTPPQAPVQDVTDPWLKYPTKTDSENNT